jgi:hypothetical protein
MRDLPRREDLPPGIDPPRPISVTFIPATVFDNPALLQINPEYYTWLLCYSSPSGCCTAVTSSLGSGRLVRSAAPVM